MARMLRTIGDLPGFQAHLSTLFTVIHPLFPFHTPVPSRLNVSFLLKTVRFINIPD